MVLKRYVIEFGMGVDLHGEDYTKASERAIKDAIYRADLCGLVEILNLDIDDIVVEVVIGCPEPDKVDVERIEKTIPVGKKIIKVVKGGLKVPGLYLERFAKTSNIVVAVAGITVKVDTSKIKIS